MDEVFAEVREQLAPSEPPAAEPTVKRKTCSKCHVEWDIDFFQRDKRSSDGKRPECKRCGARYDAMRRSLKKSMDRAVDVAVDEMQDADEQPASVRAQLEEALKHPYDNAVRATVAMTQKEAEPVQQPLISELVPEPVQVESYTAAWERPGATVLIPRFDAPIEVEVPEEGLDERRTCTACGFPKLDSEYYSRSDGRIRHQCKDCERTRSRERKRLA
jgi:transcription elongation factor Elf1